MTQQGTVLERGFPTRVWEGWDWDNIPAESNCWIIDLQTDLAEMIPITAQPGRNVIAVLIPIPLSTYWRRSARHTLIKNNAIFHCRAPRIIWKAPFTLFI